APSQYGPFINGSASQLLDLSKTLSEQSANLPGAPAQSAADTNAAATQTGAHRAENGGTLVSTLLARDTGVEQVQSTADTGRPASTDTPDAGSGTTVPPVTPAPAPVIETSTQTPDPTPPAETPTTETPTVETPAAEAPAEEPTTSPEAAETTTPAETAPSATETSTSTDSGTTDTGSTDTGADKAA
ncbi:hypothetical protein DVB87_15700, partial [Tsukamurella tyrosinosolvens]